MFSLEKISSKSANHHYYKPIYLQLELDLRLLFKDLQVKNKHYPSIWQLKCL